MSRAKTIMIQGTMSNVGKSIVTAALCRIFKEDGYRVAPFKAQNMALNSYITKEGLEMGRAQVTQAEACGIEPEVRMNPILLKPTNRTGSQVIVNGEVLGNMGAREYFSYKENLVPKVMEAFDSLCSDYDIVVIEGAGSPAEINLKDFDLVNMGMAIRGGCPVILVGDIDRGGVFAQLAGTQYLFDDDEKKHLKGFIINKYRGDKTIIEPGAKMLEELMGIPSVGITPYLNINIEDEDGLTEKFSGGSKGLIDIAVIRTPRISNFTDLDCFSRYPYVSVRYISSVGELGTPDMVVIPGTKNTMEDLLWMRQNGIEAGILKLADRGIPVFGICGGYQMLGETLDDPHCVEAGGSLRGMGLLPIKTVFAGNKVRTRVNGTVEGAGGILAGLNGAQLQGYEIHMGLSENMENTGNLTFIQPENGEKKHDGACRGNVYGTYVHGIFDSVQVSDRIVSALASAKGINIEEAEKRSYEEYKEEQYVLLAREMRKHLDMKKIYEIMEEGV